jgi:hypothetical protein
MLARSGGALRRGSGGQGGAAESIIRPGMPPLAASLLLAASFDASAAYRHAAALAALGPHPAGSPRGRAAAEYVAAQFRAVGLDEVRLADFSSDGRRGTNVTAVLRGPGSEILVLGSHHDTASASPGAHESSGGVAILIEAARVLAAGGDRPRTLVFASWDAREADANGEGRAAGARAYVRSLESRQRDVVAAIVISGAGWAEGAPTLWAAATADPRRPSAPVVAPRWLVATVLEGAAREAAPLAVGSRRLAWLVQPAARVVRAANVESDAPFAQAGIPAVVLRDASPEAPYPFAGQPSDIGARVDEAALDAMGRALVGAARAVAAAPRGPASEPTWFAAFGRVARPEVLLGSGLASALLGFAIAARWGRLTLAARAAHLLLFSVLLYRHPIPALWVFLLPNLVTAVSHRLLAIVVALVPAVALGTASVLSIERGLARGLWLQPWEMILAGLTLALLVVRAPQAAGRKAAKKRPFSRRYH